jgi:hypothetical protein
MATTSTVTQFGQRRTVERHAREMAVSAPRRGGRNSQTLTTDLTQEIGTTGLRQYGGFVLEEWLRQLQGRKAAQAFREMMDNSPVVGAILFAIEWLARGVEWRVEPGADNAVAEFVESCMDDMSHTWPDFISEALSCLPYGWADHEIVYKRRQGPQPQRPQTSVDQGTSAATTEEDDSNLASSKYSDGKVGWRKLPVRAQETLFKWEFDGYSGIQAMTQIDYHGGYHTIPIEKSLLFRSRARRNNPEGYSILRNAYVPFFRLKNIETIEAIGIERDLAGIPVATPPDGVDLYSEQYADTYRRVMELVTSIRRDEFEGVVLPMSGWKLELMSSGGSRQIDTDTIVRRYEQRIATSMLADFILVGQDSVGSFAMVDVKADLFGMAIDGILDLICEVLNRYAIPRLLALNGMDTSEPPEIRHGSAGRVDLQKTGEFLQALSLAGAPIPWTETLMKELFTLGGLPANFEEQDDIMLDPAETPDVEARLAALEAAHAAQAEPPPGAPAGPQSTANQLASERAIAAQARDEEAETTVSKADRMQAASDEKLAKLDAEMDALIAESDSFRKSLARAGSNA